MRGKISRPSFVVCRPGNGAWPRILATCISCTPEFAVDALVQAQDAVGHIEHVVLERLARAPTAGRRILMAGRRGRAILTPTQRLRNPTRPELAR